MSHALYAFSECHHDIILHVLQYYERLQVFHVRRETFPSHECMHVRMEYVFVSFMELVLHKEYRNANATAPAVKMSPPIYLGQRMPVVGKSSKVQSASQQAGVREKNGGARVWLLSHPALEVGWGYKCSQTLSAHNA